jgi:PRTRC genetic system protein B
MNQEILATLLFYDGQYEFHIHSQEKSTVKFLSPTDIAAAFRETPIDSGWIPPEIVRTGQTTATNFTIGWFPPKKYTCPFLAKDNSIIQKTVPLPGLLFAGKGKDYAVWATSCRFFPDKPLYHAPLPNVHSNGAICWGTNRPPECTAQALRQAFLLFIHSPFNRDLITGKSVKHPHDIRKHLTELQNKKSYPTKDLVPIGQLQKVTDSWLGIRTR